MLPAQLTAASFNGYPAQAKQLAAANTDILQRLPLAFVPLLLRELIVYDWKFPAERRELDRQFSYVRALSPEQLTASLAAFAQLRLPRELEQTDWVNSPSGFSEQLTAHLWATHQIDGFRQAAVDYVAKSGAYQPDPPPPSRLGIAIIGQGATRSDYRLFRKLRPHGVYYSNVRHQDGLSVLLNAATDRVLRSPQPYGHWYIDGGKPHEASADLTVVSYASLTPARNALQARMQKTFEAKVFDPEAFRSMLARTRPEDVGLASGADAVLSRFALSLLSEGSGTQVFATTFVQWAAREALRRAQPMTLVVRFAPRQREKPMNELLAESQRPVQLDPEGSLVDADMGAYYTWLNQQRLPSAKPPSFLAWFEDHGEAVVISPAHQPNTVSAAPVELADLANQIA